MPEPASVNPAHASVMAASLGVAATTPPTGSVASRMIDARGAEAAAVTLPAASLRNTYTVFAPSPATSVHGLVVANATQAVHAAVFETHMVVTARSSTPAIVSVTAAALVWVAPPLIETVPVGAVTSMGGAPTAAYRSMRGLVMALRASVIRVPVVVSRATSWSTDSPGYAAASTAIA